jgi:hypothetical protein
MIRGGAKRPRGQEALFSARLGPFGTSFWLLIFLGLGAKSVIVFWFLVFRIPGWLPGSSQEAFRMPAGVLGRYLVVLRSRRLYRAGLGLSWALGSVLSKLSWIFAEVF